MPHFCNTQAQACHCQVLTCWPCLLPHTLFDYLQHLSIPTHLNVCISHLPNFLPWMCRVCRQQHIPISLLYVLQWDIRNQTVTAMDTRVWAIHTYICIILLLQSVNCHCEALRDHLKTNSQQVFTVIITITYTQ